MSRQNKRLRLALGITLLKWNSTMLTLDASYPKDPDPKNWRTISGSKVHLTKGKIDGGAGGKFTGKKWKGKQHHQFVPEPSKMYEVSPGKQFSKEAQKHIDKLDQILKQSAKGKGKPTYYQEKIDKEEKALSALEKIDQLYEQKHGAITATSKKEPEEPAELDEFKKTNPVEGKVIGGFVKILKAAKKGSKEEVGYTANAWVTTLQAVGIPGGNTLVLAGKFADGKIDENKLIKKLISHAKSKPLYKKPLSSNKNLHIDNSSHTNPNLMEVYTWTNTGIKTPQGTVLPAETEPQVEAFNKKYGINACGKLQSNENKFINRYTAGSRHLRDFLVYGKTDPGFSDNAYPDGMTTAALQKAADTISEGLKKMKHPDMWVVRKASLKDWANKSNPSAATYEELESMMKAGKVFTNKAFLSTTISDLARSSNIGYGSNSVCRIIYVPKKASGGYIADKSNYKSEKEFLLDKGTKTRIMKVGKGEDGRIYVYEEVVLDE